MAVIKFDPFRGFERATRRINRLMDELNTNFTIESGGFNPRVDISEDNKAVYVHAEIPGVNKEDVKISVNEENLLTIKGEKKQVQNSEKETLLRNERFFGAFQRSFLLPEFLDKEKISATFNNGILEITIQKVEPPAPKEVEVQIS